jgi:sugar lactone lactonase YvrE
VHAEQLTAADAFHAEGPVWSGAWGGLRWVDMLAGDVLSLGAGGAVDRRHVGVVAAALRPRAGGGAVIAIERGFVLEDAAGGLTRLPELWSDPTIRMNEGGCDPDGRFYCGSMGVDERRGAGAVYRLDPDRTVAMVATGVTISNGLEWAPDGSAAYYINSPTRTIARFDYAAGEGLADRRSLVTVDRADGLPDGLTVDAEGGIWVALFGGAAVRRYTPAGELDAVVRLPVTNVTACTFGGEGLDTLFITTSREGLAPEVQPQAGALFSARPGVTGLPVRPYAG